MSLGYILALYPWDNHIPAKWDPTQWDLTISLGHVFPTRLCDIYLLLIAGTFPCISLGYIPASYPWDNRTTAKWDPTQWHYSISLGHIFAPYLCDIYLLLIPGTFPRISLRHILALYPWDNHIPAKWDTSVSHLLKFKKMLATPVDCASQGLNFIGTPVLCYLNRSYFFSYRQNCCW